MDIPPNYHCTQILIEGNICATCSDVKIELEFLGAWWKSEIQAKAFKIILFLRNTNVPTMDTAINKEINTINKEKSNKSYSIKREKRYFSACFFFSASFYCVYERIFTTSRSFVEFSGPLVLSGCLWQLVSCVPEIIINDFVSAYSARQPRFRGEFDFQGLVKFYAFTFPNDTDYGIRCRLP